MSSQHNLSSSLSTSSLRVAFNSYARSPARMYSQARLIVHGVCWREADLAGALKLGPVGHGEWEPID
jgi:hypothetical protein